MKNNIKRFLSLAVALVMVFAMFPMGVYADEGDMDFTDAAANESSETWAWDNESKTLTLRGASITSAVILPDGSTIYATEGTENAIVANDADAVTAEGALTITGTGALNVQTVAGEDDDHDDAIVAESVTVDSTGLTTYGDIGLNARFVAISNATVDIKGYYYGIYSERDSGSTSVNLDNVSGSIVGEYRSGIALYVESNADNDAEHMDNAHVEIKDCKNLTISGYDQGDVKANVWRSGIAVYVVDTETNAYVEIENSDINVNGASAGVYISRHDGTDGMSDVSAAWINISNSNVVATTITNTWAALFVNNHGSGEKSTATITLENSNVKALCPNDVGIMTSTVNAASSVVVRNTTLELSGKWAGIRVKSNQGEMANALLEDSVVVVNSATDYVVDDMDNAASKEGVQEAVSNTNYVAAVDCVITANDDGTWDIPAGGTVIDDGDNYTTIDAYIDTKGNVVERSTYVAEVVETGIKYETLQEAFDAADAIEGKTNVRLLKYWEEKLLLVPADITFDLNGNVVKAENVLSFGIVMDGREKVGGIQIDIDTTKAFTKLQPENGGYLPVYDTRDGIYKFFAYDVESHSVKVDTASNSVTFQNRIVFENAAGYEVLANTANSGIDFVLTMDWTGMSGFGLRFGMSDTNLQKYAELAYAQLSDEGVNTKVMTGKVYGINVLESGAFISAAPSVETIAEVTASADVQTYDIP